MPEQSSYGLWGLVAINSVIVIFFAFSFSKLKSGRDWRSFGAFSAFIVALFTEMYGIPLTIYLLSGWLQSSFPEVDLLAHNNGHLWNTIFGFEGDPHLSPVHTASNLFLVAGFLILASAWKILYRAQKNHKLAIKGLYAWVRHPQYIAFNTILFAFLLMWPTVLTIIMFPILVFMYYKLARREEIIARAEFGLAYINYCEVTPGFIPKLRGMSAEKIQTLLLLIGLLLILSWIPFVLTLFVLLAFLIIVMIETNLKIRKENQALQNTEIDEFSDTEGRFSNSFGDPHNLVPNQTEALIDDSEEHDLTKL